MPRKWERQLYKSKKAKIERNFRMYDYIRGGWSFQEVAEENDITPARVRWIFYDVDERLRSIGIDMSSKVIK